MPAWLSQTFVKAALKSTHSKSKSKGNAKQTTTRTTPQATAGSRRPLTPALLNRPPTPRPSPTRLAFSKRKLVRKPLTLSLFQPTSGSDMRPDIGNTAGPAIYAYSPRREPTSASSHHLSFSSVLAEVGIDPEITRSVRFQEASSHPEPSGYPSPSPAVKSRGGEYVNVTQGIRGRERPVPVSIPIYAPAPVPGSHSPYAVPQGPPSTLIYAPPSLGCPSPSPAVSHYARPSVTGASGYAVAAPPTPPRTSSSLSQKQPAGRLHVGSFKLLRMLERGTFTKSYAAQDTDSGRVVCARIARKNKMLQEEKIRRGLIVEMRAYSIIAQGAPRERAYLMELFGVLQDEERAVYLMPLMEGDLVDVSKAVASYGGLDRSLVRRWVAQLALGIDALHRMGIIHRDLKPENILVDASAPGQDPNVRITDFNTAFISDSRLEDGSVCTNGKIGSAPYMAWEVDQGRWYGKMVDWWALGCITFDMLTNTVLFEGHDDRQEYVWWGHRMDGMSYAAYQGIGKISEPEADLISGLVDLHPTSRFQLRHLRYHAFFLDEKKHVNVFDVLLREPAVDLLTACSSDASPSRSVKVDGSLKNEPPVHLFFRGNRLPLMTPGSENKPQRYCRDEGMSVEYAHVPELDDPFASLDWLNPRGPWRV